MFVVYWSALHHSGEHVNTISSSVSSCILCFAVTTSECVHVAVTYVRMYACMHVGSADICKKGTVIELECYKCLYPFHAVSTPSPSSHLWLNGQRDFVFLCLVCVGACVCACVHVCCVYMCVHVCMYVMNSMGSVNIAISIWMGITPVLAGQPLLMCQLV